MRQSVRRILKGFSIIAAGILGVFFMVTGIFQCVWAQETSEIMVEEVFREESQAPVSEGTYLSIDTIHAYQDMERPFSKGYVPGIKEGQVQIVIPFTASCPLARESLTVSLILPEKAPFVYASYEKQVSLETFDFSDESTQAYLYREEIDLSEEPVRGTYPVKVKASGYTLEGEELTLTTKVFVTVEEGKDVLEEESMSEEIVEVLEEEPENAGDADYSGEEKQVSHQPKLLLKSGSLLQGQIEAGTSQRIETTIQNVSSESEILNLKISVGNQENLLIVEPSSFYFERVGPREEICLQAVVSIPVTAEQKTVPITYNFEYEDETGNAFTGSEQAVCHIYQPVSAELQDLKFPEEVYSLDLVEIPVQIRNPGRAAIYNVKVEIHSEGLVLTEGVYEGSIEPKEAVSKSLKIYAGRKDRKEEQEIKQEEESYGRVNGKVILTYEDAFGAVHTWEQEITTVIQKPEIVELKVPKEKKETNQWWAAVFLVLILFFGAVITIMAWILTTTRRKMKELILREKI